MNQIKALSIIPLMLLFTNLSAQHIYNYTLGNGYKYYQDLNQSKFLADCGIIKNMGGPFSGDKAREMSYFSDISNNQTNDPSSLLSKLKNLNPELASKYDRELDRIQNIYVSGRGNIEQIFDLSTSYPVILYHNIQTLIKVLEYTSKYYCSCENAYLENIAENNVNDQAYTLKVDSIILETNARYLTELMVDSSSLKEVLAKQNTMNLHLEAMDLPYKQKRDKENKALAKAENIELYRLPLKNYQRKAAAIRSKYELIGKKQATALMSERQVVYKYASSCQPIYSKLETQVKLIRKQITAVQLKLNDVRSNLDTELPTKTPVRENKLDIKLLDFLVLLNDQKSTLSFEQIPGERHVVDIVR